MCASSARPFCRSPAIWARRRRRAAGAGRAARPPPRPGSAAPADKGSLEIYGFGQADAIADFNQNNPDWYDVNRPSRLPKFDDEFGEDGHFYLSARQSRFGVKGVLPTADGDVKAQFEFDMFGVGRDAGQTTIRLRHAWGQWKQIGAGQTNSQFMDVDVFPNTVEYWGPNGMLFFRNAQVFWEPIARARRLARCASRSSARAPAATQGVFADRIELQNVRGALSVARPLRRTIAHASDWGYVQVGGIAPQDRVGRHAAGRQVRPDGSTLGLGHQRELEPQVGENDTLRLQFIYGEGIENYFNDAPVDVGIERNPGNRASRRSPARRCRSSASWRSSITTGTTRSSTAIGYSLVDIDNSDAQTRRRLQDAASTRRQPAVLPGRRT